MSRSNTVPLSGKHVGSFAYRTIKDRMPVIVTKIVDDLYRNRNKYLDTYGQEFDDALKFIIKELSGLRHELTTNKPLVCFEDTVSPDCELWNKALEEASEEIDGKICPPSWFNSPWLLVECYMYRRFMDIVLRSGAPYFDIFHSAKKTSFTTCEPQQRQIAMHLFEALSKREALNEPQFIRTKFLEFLQLSLWGNVYDLSISALEQQDFTHAPPNPVELLDLIQDNILVNQGESLWNFVSELNKPSRTLALILDNTGMELVSDLCFCQFLVKSHLFDRVILYGKSMPWFVSDTTHADLEWTLRELAASNHLGLSRLVQWVRDSLELGTLQYRDHLFWTLPHPYGQMSSLCPDLYKNIMEEADLVIFKGDLHYRKLLGDLNWPATTPFKDTLPSNVRENWVPFCTLRVMKSDVASDVPEEKVKELDANEPDWRVRGDYALIQVCLPHP